MHLSFVGDPGPSIKVNVDHAMLSLAAGAARNRDVNRRDSRAVNERLRAQIPVWQSSGKGRLAERPSCE
jgi:hypothetical protein